MYESLGRRLSNNTYIAVLAAAGCAVLMAQPPEKPKPPEKPPNGQAQLKHGVDFTPKSPTSYAAPAGAHLNYYGGRIVSHPIYYNVLWATSSVQTYGSDIGLFFQDLGTLIPEMLSQYSTAGLPSPTSNQTIGTGTFGGTYTVTPASMSTTVDDSTIQTQLKSWIQNGQIPAPQYENGNNKTIYNVMFPHGTTITQGGSRSCAAGGFCAYHGTIGSVPGYTEVYYIVMPDQQPGSGCDTGCGSAGTNEQNYTSVLSHEVYETVTDAEVGLAR